MTEARRVSLLALPEAEEAVVRFHTLAPFDLAAIAEARTPETRLGYALQLCCLRHPGRHLRRGEVLPQVMLDHVAEQIGVEAGVVAGFARRPPTRYDQLAAIKARFGFRDLTPPLRSELRLWLERKAVDLTDGSALLDRLLDEMRARRVVVPGLSVVERMTAEAMSAAEAVMIAGLNARLSAETKDRLDTLLSARTHPRQSRFSWLREPAPRVGSRSLLTVLDRIDLVRATGATGIEIDEVYGPRMAQLAREGVRYTAQAFEQMGAPRRHVILVATLRELEVTLTDVAISMFASLVGRAHLRARKRLDQRIAASAEEGRARLLRVAGVLEAVTRTAREGGDVAAAVTAIAPFDTIDADAALLRRTTRPGRGNALAEIAPEYGAFKRAGPRFIASFAFEGRASTEPLREAMAILARLGGDWRTPLPADVPTAHIGRRWHRHLLKDGRIDRTLWELATYSELSSALASGDMWVPTSRLHRSLGALLAPGAVPTPAVTTGASMPAADAWLEKRAAQLDAALLEVSRGVSGGDPVLFAGDKLRFPKEPKGAGGLDVAPRDVGRFAARAYGLVPATRITDVLSQVERWTGFTSRFGHVPTGLPPADERAFLAALIAEATNLGLSRMADICSAASRRALLRMQTWHMREETFRAALACLTDAIHAEPLSAWFGEDWRASADGQAYYLGGPGEAGGLVNAHYGRDPIVKIHTTVTGRYAPLHQTVIAGTAGEAIHALDGIFGHESRVSPSALHVDGGGVSDIVFALMHLLGLDFEPRIPRLSDRRLYAFEPARRYGRLAPLFGQRLDRDLIAGHWDEIGRVVEALRSRTVTPSLILRKPSAYRQQNSLAAALREVGRALRTLFTLRWSREPALRRLVTAELNKGEARNSLARAVALHRLGRFRDRGLENQQIRAAALNLVTAAIILLNCRYLGRALTELRRRGGRIDDTLVAQLSPLGWDRINLTGDYVWSDAITLDDEGLMPLTPTGQGRSSAALP
jgi:TnpA family transposase